MDQLREMYQEAELRMTAFMKRYSILFLRISLGNTAA